MEQFCFPFSACVTSKGFDPYVPTAASLSGPNEWPQSGSSANLSQQRLGSSNHRVHEGIQTKPEPPVPLPRSVLTSQGGLYAAHVRASKV